VKTTIAEKGREKRTEYLPPELPPIYEETIIRALRHVAFESDTLNVKMLAREIGKAEMTAYHKLSSETPVSLREFCLIVRLAVAHGEMALIDLMLPDTYVVVPIADANGESLESEVADLVEDEGEMIDHFNNGRFTQAQKSALRGVKDSERIVRTVTRKRR